MLIFRLSESWIPELLRVSKNIIIYLIYWIPPQYEPFIISLWISEHFLWAIKKCIPFIQRKYWKFSISKP